MKKNSDHSLLNKAKQNKKDEFYTQFCDIERELKYYQNHFKGKVVFCNCDDVRISNFYKYFATNFKQLGLKKLICACYDKDKYGLLNRSNKNLRGGFFYEYCGDKDIVPIPTDFVQFKSNGDFRSAESINLLLKSDIIVTNPPFSLFREYISQLINYNKKFLVISNINAITYKEIFTLIKNNKIWLGVNLGRGISGFIVPDNYELYGQEVTIDTFGNRIVSSNNCMWLTNLDNSIRHEYIKLTKHYKSNESQYPHYDNYNAINVDKTKDIPIDYDGVIGVPITFLHKFNPEQFEIIKFRKGDDDKDLAINGKPTYFRILVRKKCCSNKSKQEIAKKIKKRNIVQQSLFSI